MNALISTDYYYPNPDLRKQMVTVLIEGGSDLSIQNETGDTALDYAASYQPRLLDMLKGRPSRPAKRVPQIR